MKHPFEGIITPSGEQDKSSDSAGGLNRRSALGVMAASAAAVGVAGAADKPALLPIDGDSKPTGAIAEKYSLWFVVPDDIRSFSNKRRAELDVLGPYLAGMKGGDEALQKTRGFLAWATAEHVEMLLSQKDIEAVHPLKPDSKQVLGKKSDTASRLMVMLAPNGWGDRPDGETYHAAETIADAWMETHRKAKIKVEVGPGGRYASVQFGDDAAVEDVVADVLGHPQVYLLNWVGATFTTQALGEEGGVSTRALGEEGGPQPTTLAIGEEGGPRPTTLAVGEEGGASTKRLGEEGGVSTQRLGEEGGALPPVSTEALGEEGGRR